MHLQGDNTLSLSGNNDKKMFSALHYASVHEYAHENNSYPALESSDFYNFIFGNTVAKLLLLGADAALKDRVRACSYTNTFMYSVHVYILYVHVCLCV